MSEEMLELLLRELDLERDDVSFHRAPLDLKGLFLVHAIDRPDLKDDPWPPVTKPRLAAAAEEERSIFSVIRERDVLVPPPLRVVRDLGRGVRAAGAPTTRGCSPSR